MSIYGILQAAGACCLLYFLILWIHVGHPANFSAAWLLLGGLLLLSPLWGWCLEQMPDMLVVSAAALMDLCLLLFFYVQIRIFTGMYQRAPEEIDCLIVLGARVYQKRPSRTLLRRLDRAAAYMKANPGTVGILSGGQGPDENESEAAVMCRYLTGQGIPPSRLRLEEKSRDTWENLKLSRTYVTDPDALVGIVTSDFHMFRSLAIAKKQGYILVTGLPSPSDFIALPNYLLREFFAVVKEKLQNKI